MISVSNPDTATLRSFLAAQQGKPFSYAEVGATQGDFPKGYDHDSRRWRIGEGEQAFKAAQSALFHWRMFPPGWTRIFPNEVPPAEGRAFAVVIRLFGLYWVNAARVAYVVEDSKSLRRAGFAYGTLEEHVEIGEERFVVEMANDGSVWYCLSAFSKPRHPLARLGYPLARRNQRRFAHESVKALAGGPLA